MPTDSELNDNRDPTDTFSVPGTVLTLSDGRIVEVIATSPDTLASGEAINRLLVLPYEKAPEPSQDTAVSEYLINGIRSDLKTRMATLVKADQSFELDKATRTIKDTLSGVAPLSEGETKYKTVHEAFQVYSSVLETLPNVLPSDIASKVSLQGRLRAAEWGITGRGTLTNQQKLHISRAVEDLGILSPIEIKNVLNLPFVASAISVGAIAGGTPFVLLSAGGTLWADSQFSEHYRLPLILNSVIDLGTMAGITAISFFRDGQEQERSGADTENVGEDIKDEVANVVPVPDPVE